MAPDGWRAVRRSDLPEPVECAPREQLRAAHHPREVAESARSSPWECHAVDVGGKGSCLTTISRRAWSELGDISMDSSRLPPQGAAFTGTRRASYGLPLASFIRADHHNKFPTAPGHAPAGLSDRLVAATDASIGSILGNSML